MVKKFATGMHESWLYNPTTSAELSILSWSSFFWFLTSIFSLFWFFEAFIPALVPFVFNLPLIEIARTQFFVRWMDCNTPFPEYVLSCVFRFSIVFFDLLLVFISYYEFFIWLFCFGSGFVDSESALFRICHFCDANPASVISRVC